MAAIDAPLLRFLAFRLRDSRSRGAGMPLAFNFQSGNNDDDFRLAPGDYALFEVTKWDKYGIPETIERTRLHQQADPPRERPQSEAKTVETIKP